MSLFKKNESYLGVDIGAYGIKIVELHKTKGRPQLWTYGMADTPLNIHLPEHENPLNSLGGNFSLPPVKANFDSASSVNYITSTLVNMEEKVEKYSKILRHLIKEAGVTTPQATASLPVSYVFHAVLTLPLVKESEIPRFVMAKVKKMLPLPIEEMQIEQQIIGNLSKDAKDIKVLVTAAPTKIVSFYSAIFKKAGLQLKELETEAFALERSLVGRDTATVMIVDVGSERTNFFIVDGGLPLTHRSSQMGGDDFDEIIMKNLGVKRSVAMQIKKDLANSADFRQFEKIFAPVIEPIIKEIKYGFELFFSQSGNETKRPEKIILTGGLSIFPPIISLLQKEFNIKVFVGDPWARVVYQQGIKLLLDGIGPRMSVAIGLALRNIVH